VRDPSTSSSPALNARWDPKQYELFARERSLPFSHLLAAVPALEARRIADLGCGSGIPTLELARRWPSATIWAIDSSPEMVEEAHRRGFPPSVHFIVGDLAIWQAPELLDLIVSNAALHWIENHEQLLAHLASQLAPGGTLAFQVPNNFTEPSHRLLYELMEEVPWHERLASVRRPAVHAPGWYQSCLAELGFETTVWETTYHHLLTGENPVLEWIRGATLRPVLAVLDREEGAQFVSEYAQRLARAYPPGPLGTVLPFRRIFVLARRGHGQAAGGGLH
jgi:trans-aconitate 2-methyltransferase